MKKMSKSLSIIICLVMLSSCEDFFETTLEIDPPEHTETLAVHAFGNSRTNELNVLVSDTRGILESFDFDTDRIDNAEVKLFLDNELIAVLENQSQETANYVLPEGTHDFQVGATYKIEVTAPDYPVATAFATIAHDVNPIALAFEEDAGADFEQDSASGINVTINDDPAKKDFYEVYCLMKNSSSDPSAVDYFNISTDSLDPTTVYGFRNLMYNDETFNGEEKTFELRIRKFTVPEEIDLLHLNWRIVSEDHFLFNKSLQAFFDADGNPFASPVQIYSNFENAIGIFSIVNETIIKVQ